MMHGRSFAQILFLVIAVFAKAQVAQRVPNVVIVLPAGIPSDEVDLQGYLFDSFGAIGGVHMRAARNVGSVEIHAAVKGKVANRLKLFARAPGCETATYDITIQASEIQEFYYCHPLSMVKLVGQVATTVPRTKPAKVQVIYAADWACHFFDLPGCMTAPTPLGTTKLGTDGRFEIKLPDFNADPTSSRLGGGSIHFFLIEIETLKVITVLQPESPSLRISEGLKPASLYPAPVVFVKVKGVHKI
jgi:hypothetical protein